MDSARAARLFEAFSDPTRLRILALLRRGERCVCDVVDVLRIPQGRASRHLGRLKKAGMVRSREQRYWTYYSIAPARGGLHRSLLAGLDAAIRGSAALRRDARGGRSRC